MTTQENEELIVVETQNKPWWMRALRTLKRSVLKDRRKNLPAKNEAMKGMLVHNGVSYAMDGFILTAIGTDFDLPDGHYEVKQASRYSVVRPTENTEYPTFAAFGNRVIEDDGYHYFAIDAKLLTDAIRDCKGHLIVGVHTGEDGAAKPVKVSGYMPVNNSLEPVQVFHIIMPMHVSGYPTLGDKMWTPDLDAFNESASEGDADAADETD